MATRPYWTGQLRISLVTVPVQLFTATRSANRLTLHKIHEPTGKRVHYENVVEGVGAVKKDDIVRGYEYAKGEYVLLEPEEVESLRLESRKTVDIVQFVKSGEIPAIYFERPYYVLPENKLAEDAYVTLRDALDETGMVGLGQLTLHGAEQLVAIKACSGGILMETLRYEDEVREAAAFFEDVAGKTADKEMRALARELIAKKEAPFDPGRFRDHYAHALRELIDAKLEHRPVPEEREAEEAPVIDFMAALRQSVEKAEGGKKKAAPPKSSAGKKKKPAAGKRPKPKKAA